VNVVVMCVLSQELKAELESRTTALSAQVKMLSQQNQVKLSYTCTIIVTTYLCIYIVMVTCWHDDKLTSWHDDMSKWWHHCSDMSTWWHINM